MSPSLSLSEGGSFSFTSKSSKGLPINGCDGASDLTSIAFQLNYTSLFKPIYSELWLKSFPGFTVLYVVVSCQLLCHALKLIDGLHRTLIL